MPRELITVQIGQCGMQLGSRFWDLAMREHAQAMSHNPSPVFDEAMSSFFRNVKVLSSSPADVLADRSAALSKLTGSSPTANTTKSWASGDVMEVPVGDGKQPIYSLRARAVCIDMEEGVLNEVRRGPLGELFDTNQFIHDVSGSGNNWAHGHCLYGPQYEAAILDCVRRVAEKCDSLQSFFLMHSLGGGTGSGLGTFILQSLADHYPDVYRFNVAVFPSPTDDVITSPYNSVLSLNELRKNSDCVLPIDNAALASIVDRMNKTREKEGEVKERVGSLGVGPESDAKAMGLRSASSRPVVEATLVPEHGSTLTPAQDAAARAKAEKSARLRAFDEMNSIAAHLLTSLTASIRFPGALNVDLNEVTMNLVPYPRMHFLLSSLAPIYSVTSHRLQPRSLDQLFSDVLLPENHLLSVGPKSSVYLACGLFARGEGIRVADIARNVARIKTQIRMASWNSDGFKTGLCSVPPVGLKSSVLALSNNSCIAGLFSSMRDRFNRLYVRKAHVHHYTQYTDLETFDNALEGLSSLITDYGDASTAAPQPLPRLEALG